MHSDLPHRTAACPHLKLGCDACAEFRLNRMARKLAGRRRAVGRALLPRVPQEAAGARTTTARVTERHECALGCRGDDVVYWNPPLGAATPRSWRIFAS